MGESVPLGATSDLMLQVPSEQLDRLAAAAHFSGVSVADFVLAAVKAAADDTLSGYSLVRLPPADANTVVATLNVPAPASEALRQIIVSSPPWKARGDNRG